ncbi:MAG: glycosyltransferase family 87 protein [Bacteroidetes bacterium]|nr:glycosyltransferase family 87 protein [Bacteroidota bacterium]
MKIKDKLRFPSFYWVLGAFFLLFFIAEVINHRFELNDFKVYYLAMQNFINGDAIYYTPFGLQSGFYKYSPFALIPFSIFYAIPYIVASIIYYLLICIAIFFVLTKSYRLINEVFNFENTQKSTILYFTLLILLNHFYRELHLGNVNVLLLLLYLVSFEKLLKNKEVSAGILMGIGLLFKLHFIVLLPVLFLFGKFKTSILMAGSFIIGLFLPAVFLGYEANNALLKIWVSTMKGHNTNINSSSDTIYAWVNKLLSTIGLEQKNLMYSLIILALIAAVFLWLIFRKNHQKPIYSNFQKFSLIYLVVIAIVPSITLTDSEHFLFSLPVVMLSLFLFFIKPSITIYDKVFIITAFVLYGGNWHDLWGHRISVFFAYNGFLGLGNLLLIAFILWKIDVILKKN